MTVFKSNNDDGCTDIGEKAAFAPFTIANKH